MSSDKLEETSSKYSSKLGYFEDAKFEYAIVSLVGPMASSVLNSWGALGWELVSVLSAESNLTNAPNGGASAIFKRKLRL